MSGFLVDAKLSLKTYFETGGCSDCDDKHAGSGKNSPIDLSSNLTGRGRHLCSSWSRSLGSVRVERTDVLSCLSL
jgi:hypothetical protein